MVDFGIAKATSTTHQTRAGEIKGKLSYMAPEQLEGVAATRSADIYSASVVLWEALTGKQLFKGENDGATIYRVLKHEIVTPSRIRRDIPLAIDAIVRRGLDANPSLRWETARAMAEALEHAIRPVTRRMVGEWVTSTAQDELRVRQEKVALVESSVMPSRAPSMPPRPTLVDPGNAVPSRTPSLPPPSTVPETAPAGGSLGTAHQLSQVLSQRPIARIRRVSVTALGAIGVLLAMVLIWAMAPRGIRQPTGVTRLSAAAPIAPSAVVPPTLAPVSTESVVTPTAPPSAPELAASAVASAAPAQESPKKRARSIGQSRSPSSRATNTDSLYRRD